MKEKSKYCQCLCHASNVLARNMTKLMDEELAVLNLTSSYAYLLMEVDQVSGVNPKAISKSLELAPSTVTRLIEKMEHRGLLSREQEGRSTSVYLTESGEQMISKVHECLAKFQQRYEKLVGTKNVQELTSNIYDAAMQIEEG